MARPILYVTIVVLAAIGTYVYKLRTEGIFACTADGYDRSAGSYLAYCHAPAYGDYDHGAVWFGLEPGVRKSAAAADVLFVGNSRMQFGFSTTATNSWFDAAGATYYLLGFGYTENVTFLSPLLNDLKPRARVYIIDVDRVFDDVETGPGSEVLHRNDAARRYREKGLWQPGHRLLCTRLPSLCGNQHAFFRHGQHGQWTNAGTPESPPALTAEGPPSRQDEWGHFAALAQRFVAGLPVDRSCVLLTIVPSSATMVGEAAAIANAVGLDLINPGVSGFQSFDGSHLEPAAAEQWSKAFFDLAGPQIMRCLSGNGQRAGASG